jgi:sarcosine oxidase subunit beta
MQLEIEILGERRAGAACRWTRHLIPTPSACGCKGMPCDVALLGLVAAASNAACAATKSWERAWRDPEPEESYDVIIVGGGGHGLATAYYLAKNHGIKNIAVLDKGYIGSGNAGRNTTIVRSNYMMQENTPSYEHRMELRRGMSRRPELQRDVLAARTLVAACSQGSLDGRVPPRQHHAPERHPRRDPDARRGDEGGAATWTTRTRRASRSTAACCQPDAGTARHDAVAWGYARAAERAGCGHHPELRGAGLHLGGRAHRGREDRRAATSARRQGGRAVAGHTSVLAQRAGLSLPIESHVLQALCRANPSSRWSTTWWRWSATYFYVSQSDKGGLVFGGHIDRYNSYAQRGNLANVSEVSQALVSAGALCGAPARAAPLGRHHGHDA